jgi:hypothetical protein
MASPILRKSRVLTLDAVFIPNSIAVNLAIFRNEDATLSAGFPIGQLWSAVTCHRSGQPSGEFRALGQRPLLKVLED